MKIVTDVSVSSRRLHVGTGFSPGAVLRNATSGVWINAVETARMFSNTAGTPPHASPAQQVALAQDLSVNALHALQPSAALRPLLGRAPLGGRRNLLSETGFTTLTSGAPGGGTWAGFNRVFAGGAQTVTPGDASLGGASVRVSVTDGRHVWRRTDFAVPANTFVTWSAGIEVHSGAVSSIDILSFPTISVANISCRVNGSPYSTTAPLPLGASIVETTIQTTAATALECRLGVGLGTDRTGDVTFRDPQFEFHDRRTDYQRVNANGLDITAHGAPSPGFIRFDLSDDVLASVIPDGGIFDVMVSGRSGSCIERSVQIAPGGSLDIGPATITGGPSGLLAALGDIVGWVAVDRTVSPAEIAQLLKYYKARGAGPLLEEV